MVLQTKYYASRNENTALRLAMDSNHAPNRGVHAQPTAAHYANKLQARRDRQRVADREHHRFVRAQKKSHTQAVNDAAKAALYDKIATFAVKEHGMLRPRVRELIRKLDTLGVPHTNVFEVTKAVLDGADVHVSGKFSAHTARRVLAEGLVHSEFQVIDVLKNASCEPVSNT